MIRQSPTVHLVLVALGLTLGMPSLVLAQTTPQDPSYEDQWIETNVESSPFLELRNEGNTDASDGPEPPDTPTVDDVEAPEGSGESSDETKKDDEPETTGSQEPDTEPTSGTEEDTQPDTQPSGTDEAPGESSQTRDKNPTKSESEGEPETKNTAKKRVSDLFKDSDVISAGASLVDLEVVSGTVALHDVPPSTTAVKAQPVDPAPTSPESSWWWLYRYWLGGGLVVLFVTGMFFWSRRRRVTVIERNYPSAEDFFQDELKRSRKHGSQDDGSIGDRSVDLDEGPVTPASSGSPSDSLMESLNEHGFDEKHQALVEKYYSEGLSRREVAEQSSLGDGEVGLVLDLADRIREEKTHAERA